MVIGHWWLVTLQFPGPSLTHPARGPARMQTVNFNCPHCGNLMAVGHNLLGRNVRCPHCKQVVRAPAAAGEPAAPPQAAPPTPPPPPPAPVPTFNVPDTTEHHESIFGERHDEDVFGTEPARPTVPPPAPPPQPPPPPPPSAPAPYMGETVTVSALQPPSSPLVPPAPPPPYPSAPPPPMPRLSDPSFSFGQPELTPEVAPLPDERDDRHRTPPPHDDRRDARPERGYQPRARRDEAAGTPAFTWILLAYALLITIAAGFFAYQYFTGDSGGHPFKAMPDVLREYDPAKKPQMSFKGLPDPKLDVPPDLRVKLGGELTVGDLKVQPTAVEKKKVLAHTIYTSDDDKKRPVGEALVLTLHVTNVSRDTAFIPNDPAFVRAPDSKQPLAPYTALQIGYQFYYGGIRWPHNPGVKDEYLTDEDEKVKYREEDKPLSPGDERDTHVAVAPTGVRTGGGGDAVGAVEEAKKAKTPLLWRVQLRRGLVKDGDREISATTVIGVEFRADEVR